MYLHAFACFAPQPRLNRRHVPVPSHPPPPQDASESQDAFSQQFSQRMRKKRKLEEKCRTGSEAGSATKMHLKQEDMSNVLLIHPTGRHLLHNRVIQSARKRSVVMDKTESARNVLTNKLVQQRICLVNGKISATWPKHEKWFS